LQLETIERLSALGDMDSDAIAALEHELAAWVEHRVSRQNQGTSSTMANILAAADAKTRDAILRNLNSRQAEPANRSEPPEPNTTNTNEPIIVEKRSVTKPQLADHSRIMPAAKQLSRAPSVPPFDFDELVQLDGRMLASVMRQVDPNVLALALVGSREELVDRICDQMPKRTARTFRRELRRLGPTRLSDVETAQRAVARIATQHLAARRRVAVIPHCYA
jgi:flagellar motor switch protein FliG